MPFDLQATVELFAWMLLGASILGIVAWRIRVPYAVALVLGGLIVAQTHFVALPQLDPAFVLFVCLPPLLFDAAFRLDERELRIVAQPVLVLAIPGTIATAAIVSAVLVLVLHLPLAVSVLFGSIVAATDPVAVVAVFRGLHTSQRLAVIAEGESLINDGIAITLYTAALGLVALGTTDVGNALLLFVKQVVGGVVIGVFLGIVFSRLSSIIDDHLVEMTLSTALAYGSYLVGQSLGVSGALACVAAGFIHGSYGREVGMSERTRRLLDDLWEYFGFLVNALVFLLVGFSANLSALAAAAGAVLASIASVFVSRIFVVMLPPVLFEFIRVRTMSNQHERAVLVWGGLRGALTITLALALPAGIPERQLLIAMAFGVVLFSLLVQALTLSVVVRRLGLEEAK